MSEELLFFSYLLEKYASYKQMSAADVLKMFDEKGVTQEVYDGYWGYHQEAIQNAFADIDELLLTGKHAF